jgi:hypothetical protein
MFFRNVAYRIADNKTVNPGDHTVTWRFHCVGRVLGYRSGGPGSIPGTTRKKVVGLERGPPSLVSTTEELLDRKVAAPSRKPRIRP